MATQSQSQDLPSQDRMPLSVRLALLGAVGAALVGALYLISVRGEALLVDLSALSQRMFCF